MERNMEIEFNKLGTVKWNNEEFTHKEFLNKMIKLIISDIDSNRVKYNEKENCYIVTYVREEYRVKYCDKDLNKENGTETLLNYFDLLINITKIQDKIKTEEEIEENRIKSEEFRRKNRIMNDDESVEKANESIAKKIADYEKEIEDLKAEWWMDDESTLLNIILAFLLTFNYGDLSYGSGVLKSISGWTGLIALLGLTIASLCGVSIPLALFLISALGLGEGVCFHLFTNEDRDHGYRGPTCTLLSLGLLPLVLPCSIIFKIIERIGFAYSSGRYKRKIKNLKRKQKMQMVNSNEFKNIKSVLAEENVNTKDLLLTINEFKELKDNILLIKDEKLKKTYANELYKIIEDFVNANKLKENNRDKTFVSLLDKLNNLKEKVNNKRDNEENTNSYYKLMTEINDKKEEIETEEIIEEKRERRV
jgi:hypothetical protein